MPKAIRILAVDGEEIILRSVARALKTDENIEYAVVTANNAIEGLRLVRGNMFDIIFVDSLLPGMSTGEAIRRIKNTCPSASVILMSGYSSEHASKDEETGNADGILSKPFTSAEIRSLVSRILRERAGQGE